MAPDAAGALRRAAALSCTCAHARWGLQQVVALSGSNTQLSASSSPTFSTCTQCNTQTLQQPGAQELAREVSSSLSQRFLARVIKFGFGIGEATKVQAAAQADPKYI